MNILLIIPENKGTIASVSYTLYKGLCKVENAKVYVACLGNYAEDGFQFENVYKLSSSGIYSTVKNRWYKLRNIKKKLRIDISISTLTGANLWNVLSGIGEKKIGVVHTRISQLKYLGILNYYYHLILTQKLYVHLDKIIAVNKTALEDCLKYYKKTPSELSYNIHDFAKIEKLSKEALSQEEKKIFDKSVVLFVGNLYIGLKGPDRLIRAFNLLPDNIKANVNLVFVGSDRNSLKKLKEIVDVLSLENVFFLGHKVNPYKYMVNSKLLVSPSIDEGLPGVLIEALSLGVKCVATNSSKGVWEIMNCDDSYVKNLQRIKKTAFGYIVPNDKLNETFTEEQLAKAIELCLMEKNLFYFDRDKYSEENIINHFIK